MLKRLSVIFLVLCAFMALHSPAWAAAVNTEVAVPTEIALTADEAAALTQLAAAGKPLMKVEPWVWLLSIPVAGLAQFLMGDTMRGVLFLVGTWGAGILIGILSPILLLATGGLAIAILPILGLIPLAVWIWAVVDAYFMNQAMMGRSAALPVRDMNARKEFERLALQFQ